MVDDDNQAEDDLGPEATNSGSSEYPGPRRSTWAPPPPVSDAAKNHMSDDDLAQALEEDLGRTTHTLSTPVVDEPVSTPVADPGPPLLDGPPIVHHLEEVAHSAEIDDFESGDSQPAKRPDLWAEAVSSSGTGPEPEPSSAPEPAPELERETRGSPSGPPPRRSVPTAELAAELADRVEGGDSSGELIAKLEEQLRLRNEDAAEFRRWQESMVAAGDPGAIAAVEAAREVFDDIIDNGEIVAPATPHGNDDGTLGTHRFSVDAVTDSELSSAPAPRTAPVSDIPPPSSHTEAAISMPAAPPLIPDLVEPAATTAADPFDFDAVIGGGVATLGHEPSVFSTPQEPTPAGAPEPVQGMEESVSKEPVSEESGVDQLFPEAAGPSPVSSEGIATLPDTGNVPYRSADSVSDLTAGTPLEGVDRVGPRAFTVEEASVAPTRDDQRVGRASRLFWLWFAVNSSVVSVAFGGAIFSLGMSLRQAVVATLIGVSVSFLPLGLGTLAGKWSGQPTMIVSRATFGHLGNILPAVLAIMVRVFWGAVLLWFLAAGTARILAGAELIGQLSEAQVTIIGLAVGFLLALVFAFFGYGIIARIQLGFTIISALLIVGLIVITWPAVNIPEALTAGDGPWILVLTGAVLVFSFVGLVWAVSSADLARYQRPSGSGAASMLSSTFGATIPAFVLIAYGAVLAASNPDIATGLIETPLDTISLLIPVWYPVPLIAALALSLLSGVVMSIYSGGFALQATGVSMRRSAAAVIVGAAIAGLAVLIAVSVGDFTTLLRDVATSLAVPIAAWAGIFGAEMMIRSKNFVSAALVKRGGVYSDFNWVNLTMLIVASGIGFGLTTATVSWLGWQGYLFQVAGVPLSSDLASSDLGVFVALVVGLLTPIIAGIPRIRRQESAVTSQQPAPPQ